MDALLLDGLLKDTAQGSDACGTEYLVVPFRHFAGNFWWTTRSLINGLNFPINGRKLRPIASINANFTLICVHYLKRLLFYSSFLLDGRNFTAVFF